MNNEYCEEIKRHKYYMLALKKINDPNAYNRMGILKGDYVLTKRERRALSYYIPEDDSTFIDLANKMIYLLVNDKVGKEHFNIYQNYIEKLQDQNCCYERKASIYIEAKELIKGINTDYSEKTEYYKQIINNLGKLFEKNLCLFDDDRLEFCKCIVTVLSDNYTSTREKDDLLEEANKQLRLANYSNLLYEVDLIVDKLKKRLTINELIVICELADKLFNVPFQNKESIAFELTTLITYYYEKYNIEFKCKKGATRKRKPE